MHGRFDPEARDRSLQLWARMHRVGLAALALGLAGTSLLATRRRNGP